MRQLLAFLFSLVAVIPALAQNRQPVEWSRTSDGRYQYLDFTDADAPKMLAPKSASAPAPQAVSITQEVVVDFQCLPNPGNPSSGNVRLYCDSGTGNLTCLTSTGASCLGGGGGGGGGGGATSVGLAAPTGFVVTNSPVTTTGTLTLAMPSGWILGDLLVGNGANSVARLAAPTTPNGVPQVCASIPSAGIGQICSWTPAGLTNRDVTGTTATDIVLNTDCTNGVNHKESVANAVTLPTATTLGVPSCVFLISNNTSGTNTNLTITPTTPWTINGVSTVTVYQNQTCRVSVDGATNWKTDCAGTGTIAHGTAALNTNPISSAACDTVVTVAAGGIATSDNILADFNADPTGTVGYQPLVSGMLTIIKYPTSGNVNFKVCNNTASSITPGAVTLNWRVVR